MQMRAIARTASTGWAPTDVSCDSITASVPSQIALATSEASARVGRFDVTIDSSISVAVITGTPARGLRRRQRDLGRDRKSTRLNSSHRTISYAVFCLQKKT